MANGSRKSMRWMLGVQVAVLIVFPLALAGVAIGVIYRSSSDYSDAAAAYRELTRAFDFGSRVRTARTLIATGSLDLEERGLGVGGGGITGGGIALREIRGVLRQIASDQVDRPGQFATLENVLQRAESALAGRNVSRARAELDLAIGELGAISRQLEGRITASEDAARHRQTQALWTLVGAAVAFAVLAAGVAVVQYRTIARPVERLTQVVRRAKGGELPGVMEVSGPAELHELAREFNRMAGQLEALYRDLEGKVEARTRELVRSARLASVGVLAAGVAHEINNPLSIITGYGERAIRFGGAKGSDVEETLRVIVEEAYRCKGITEKLLSLARAEPVTKNGLVNLVTLTREGVEKAGVLAGERRILIEAASEHIEIKGQRGALLQVIMNLLMNAIEATPDAGTIEVSVRQTNETVILSVSDSGIGMTPETVAKVFEPFFTTKREPSRPGVGLGLSIVQAIVEDHGGRVSVTSDGPGRGARFEVHFPSKPALAQDSPHNGDVTGQKIR